jgi:arylsulfatase A-like enzyme
LAALTVHPRIRSAEARSDSRPNILIILTDDQRARGTYEMMPKTMQLFRDGGTWFTNGFATTPLCCPSRASLFTGRYAHNHGVTTTATVGELDESTTVQASLHSAGYATAMVGKYRTGGPIVNFDRWATMWPKHEYVGSRFNVQGRTHRVMEYSTDFIGEQAVDYLDLLADQPDPWYMVVSVYAPHSPALPASRDRGAPIESWDRDPAVQESDLSDKPSAVQKVAARIGDQRKLTERMRARQLRSLVAVDDVVDRIYDRLGELDEDGNTLAFFMSDNGYMWHEHGLRKKGWPYDDSVRVPMFMRWPGHVAQGLVDDELAANIDIAPTIYDAVGISPPVEPDGISLFDPARRDELVLEYWEPRASRTWSALRGLDYLYTEWANGEKEYYDLTRDPWQLENLYSDGGTLPGPGLAELSRRLQDGLGCEGSACP